MVDFIVDHEVLYCEQQKDYSDKTSIVKHGMMKGLA